MPIFEGDKQPGQESQLNLGFAENLRQIRAGEFVEPSEEERQPSAEETAQELARRAELERQAKNVGKLLKYWDKPGVNQVSGLPRLDPNRR